MRHLPDGVQNDGRASSSIGTGGCAVSGQRCWKLGTRGHSRTMTAARPEYRDRPMSLADACVLRMAEIHD
jgi:hypothetical protein